MPKRKIDEVYDNYSRSSNYRFLAACAASSSEGSISDSENESSDSSHIDSSSSGSKSSSDRNSYSHTSCVNNTISDRGNEYAVGARHQDISSDDAVNDDASSSEEEPEDPSEEDESSIESEDLGEDDAFVDAADQSVYPGAPLSVAESILSIFTVALRFRVTRVLLSKHCIS
ncbi:uncharacterized protein LOC116738577 [Nasonia vitripennis]|uniref:Uncharacterized protein n=1 Tax=Nasonia vitripennis TaxID=7425 RepID=A0A7M7TDG4_NASVI|nr:uncharacterized protein LOC116738577 [Nasonia vitripennis]